MQKQILCYFDGPQFLIFSENVPDILYYSHIPSILLMTILFAVLFSRRHNMAVLSILTMFFFTSLWLSVDVVIWASNRADFNMLYWFLQIIFEPLIFIAGFYAVHYYLLGRRPHLLINLFSFFSLLLLFLFAPTQYALYSVDLNSCNVNEGPFSTYYTYFVEIIFAIGILGITMRHLIKRGLAHSEKQKFYLGIGIFFFLIAFQSGNVVGSITGDWEVAQYGLFGIPFMIALISYIVVKYQAFDIKLTGAHVLTVSLIVLVGSQLLFTKSTINLILTSIAFALVCLFGIFLIRSITSEVRQKEHIQVIARQLAISNERLKELDTAKSEFISIASHQLRTPLTAIKGYVSLLLEGSYGVLSQDSRDVLDKVYSVNDRLTHLVEDLLNVSRIEAGRIQYDFRPVQLADILTELYDGFMLNAKSKSLDVSLHLPTPPLPKILADPNKIKEVVSNLIDNSIKYTPEGSVTITLAAVGQNARITIADTGIGIKPEDKPNLFSKFTRSKETSRMVVGGAGLGLYVGKNFIDAHKGRIWADSEGPGKGSQFIVELPIVNTAITPGTTTQSRE